MSRITSLRNASVQLSKYSRRVRHYETIELCDLQTGGGDELDDWPIHVAPAADELRNWIETILDSCDSRIVAAAVLEKHIVGLGFQNTPDLSKRRCDFADRAQRERCDDPVKRLVFERQSSSRIELQLLDWHVSS